LLDLGVDLVHRPCNGSFEAAAGALARILEERPQTTGLIVQNEGIIPPLMSALGTHAVELLMRRMDIGSAGEVLLLPPALTVRGSTGPCPT
jgi:hypothetical protein